MDKFPSIGFCGFCEEQFPLFVVDAPGLPMDIEKGLLVVVLS